MSWSAHGSQILQDRLRVYHQGGLDTYCGFYAILNLVNFLKLLKDPENGDFLRLGAPRRKEKPFETFNRFKNSGGFRGFFPDTPFGDQGLDAPMLKDALSRTLREFHLDGTPEIRDDPSVDPYGKPADEWQTCFRPGTEKLFSSEREANKVLGLAVVKEDKHDDLGHWVVFIGNNHLKSAGLNCENGWNGVVLDSDRGYELWKIDTHDRYNFSCISLLVNRDGTKKKKQADWIYSFISLSLDQRA